MKIRSILLAGVLALAGAACGGSEETAQAGGTQTRAAAPAAPAQAPVQGELQTLRSELDRYPEYSVVLAGLRSDTDKGVPAYYHQYRLVWLDEQKNAGDRTTDWTAISKTQYDREQSLTGQAVLRKLADGQIDTVAAPPALAYVGNPQYGQWQRDDQGQNYWQPAAQYMQFMLMAEIIDEIGDAAERKRYGRVYRSDYDRYRSDPYAYRTRYSDTYRTGYTRTYGKAGAPARPATFNDRVRSDVKGTAQRPASFNDRVKSEVRGTGAVPATPAAAAATRRATPATAATPARPAATAARPATPATPASASNGSYRPGRAAAAPPSSYTPPKASAPEPSYRPPSTTRSSGGWSSGSSSGSRSSGRRSSSRRRN